MADPIKRGTTTHCVGLKKKLVIDSAAEQMRYSLRPCAATESMAVAVGDYVN